MGFIRSATVVTWCVLAAFLLAPFVASAQEEDGGGEGGGEDFVEPFAEVEAEAELPESDETEGRLEREPTNPHPDNVIWTLRVGGNLTYGNSRMGALAAQTSFGLRRGGEVLVAEGQFYYGISSTPLSCGAVQTNPAQFPMGTVDFCGPSGTGMAQRARAPGFNDWAETQVNLTWRLRYDHFFDDNNAFYVMHRGRIDRFAGIQPRVGLSLGYTRVLFEELQHMLALDFGVDGTFDIYPASIVAQTNAIVASGGTLPVLSGTDARFVPSVRLGVVYVNHLNPFLTYDTTFEGLWDVANPTHFRFEWINHLRSAIDQTFQFVLDLTFRLDGLPPGQARVWVEDATVQTTTMFEVLSTLSLQGTFDLDGEPMYRTSDPEEEQTPHAAPPAAEAATTEASAPEASAPEASAPEADTSDAAAPAATTTNDPAPTP